MVGKIISVILTGLVVGSSVAVLVQIFLYSINFLSNIFINDKNSQNLLEEIIKTNNMLVLKSILRNILN